MAMKTFELQLQKDGDEDGTTIAFGLLPVCHMIILLVDGCKAEHSKSVVVRHGSQCCSSNVVLKMIMWDGVERETLREPLVRSGVGLVLGVQLVLAVQTGDAGTTQVLQQQACCMVLLSCKTFLQALEALVALEWLGHRKKQSSC